MVYMWRTVTDFWNAVNVIPAFIVSEYKYFGNVIDDKLNWNWKTEAVYRNTNRDYIFEKIVLIGSDCSLACLWTLSVCAILWLWLRLLSSANHHLIR